MSTHWLLLLAALTTTILPAPPEPKSKKLSRGPGWTDNLDRIQLTPEVIQAVKDRTGSFQRVAILPNDNAASIVAADLLQSGLRYGKGIVLVDWQTARDLLPDTTDPRKLSEAAVTESIDALVRIEISEPMGTIQLFNTEKGDAPARLWTVLPNEIIDSTVKARRELLAALTIDTTGFNDELLKTPQGDRKGLEAIVAAKQAFSSAATKKDQAAREKRFTEAIEYADRAISSSPQLIDSYIIKASAYDELGKITERDDAISEGRNRLSSRENDSLAVLELKADYERFNGRVPKAIELYLQMLQMAPTSLTARWALMDILLTGTGKEKISPQDLQTAEQMAAEIVVYHPHSPIAKVLR